MPRVLVTNDDGIKAPGLHALVAALVGAGYDDLVVAAPAEDMSGAAAALGPGHATGVGTEPMELPGLPGVEAHAVDGPPALAVMVAHLGVFGPRPDMVVSGINNGANTGRSVLFSGTVGAALAAANFGLSGVAVSLQSGQPRQWQTAQAAAVVAAEWLAASARGTVLNVNAPNIALADVRGVRVARLAPFGAVRTAMVANDGGRVELELRPTTENLEADTDTMLVRAGYIAVTGLVGPRAVDHDGVAETLEERLRS